MSTGDQSGDTIERSVSGFLLRYSARQQLVILFLTAISFPVYYVSLELPKQIINKALDAPATEFPFAVRAFGYQFASLTQVQLLVGLSALFLLSVLANLGLKFVLNLYKGLLGERMLRRLRYQLFDRVIHVPLPRLRKIPKGDLVSMITAEVESIGGFVGEALATPLYQGGLLITALVFIFVQDWVMGLLAVAFYPLQVIVIPYLQSQVNELGRRRVQEIRRLSNKLNETVEIAGEIHANRTERYELADFSSRLSTIFRIRYQIYHKKFLIKFLNSFFSQLTPFLFFSVGGYFVIRQEMSLGELVAILAAYKDLAPPWRELLDFYQDQQNARIRYDQIVSTLIAGGQDLLEAPVAAHGGGAVPKGALKGEGLSVEYDGTTFLRDISFEMGLDDHVGVVGPSDSGNKHLALLVAGLMKPTKGTLRIGTASYAAIGKSWFEEKVAYVDKDPGFTSGNIFENIIYPLRRVPQLDMGDRVKAPRGPQDTKWEEILTGNSLDEVAGDWIDYASIGLSGLEDLKNEVIRLLDVVDFQREIFDLGFGATIDPAAHPDIAAGILSARRSVQTVLATEEFKGSLALLDPLDYNPHATVLENILFGDPAGPRYEAAQAMQRGTFRRVLKTSGLDPLLLRLGLTIAQSLPPDGGLNSFEIGVRPEAPHEFRKNHLRVLLAHAAIRGLNKITGREKRRLQSLALQYVASKDEKSKLDEEFISRVLAARKRFASHLTARRRSWISAYDPEAYCASLTVSENILFAKIAPGRDDLPQRLRNAMLKVLDAERLSAPLIRAGLLYDIGPEGSALSSNQKLRLSIVRGLIKKPDLLVAFEATAGLGKQAERRIIKKVRDEMRGRGIFWVSSDESLAGEFDRTLHI